MATIVLTTVGAIVGGPIGAAIGAVVGSQVDQRLLAPKGRQGPRLDDLTVQGSAYGTPIARLYGTIRAAGNIIWSTGLKETAHRTGGGKQSGGRTTTFSYSASFAVALSARPIVGIGRIWGDGKLLRGASGELTAEGRLRIYRGDERQLPDPLIVAAEGMSNAPAYRGVAYAVFEDLQLGDFANRIPNLAFEVIADAGRASIGSIAADLARAAGEDAAVDGLSVAVSGFAAARPAPLSTWVAALSTVAPVRILSRGDHIRFHDQATETPTELTPRTLVKAGRDPRALNGRSANSEAATAVTLGFLDTGRDYMPGLQRAFRITAAPREEHFELPAAMPADTAKRLAQDILQRRWRQRESATRRVSYGLLALAPGDRLNTEDGSRWEVRRASLEGMAVELELEPVHSALPASVVADGGRANREPDLPQGETVFHVFETAPLAGELPTQPRLLIAAGGTGAGWRRAEVWTSADRGATWTSVGLAGSAGVIGSLTGQFAAADADAWDSGGVDVELVSDAMWLEGRAELSVLAGANMALVGDELLQFRHAEATGPRRFRLSRLLRGRRASAAAAHPAGARFAVIDPAGLFAVNLPVEMIGSDVLVRLVAPNTAFADAPTTVHRVTGEALRPLPPVHVRARALGNGDIEIGWVRRSRAGFGWIDGADAPLGETAEAYRVRIAAGAASAEVDTAASRLVLSTTQQMAAFGLLPTVADIKVRQLSAVVGPGRAASATFHFNR